MRGASMAMMMTAGLGRFHRLAVDRTRRGLPHASRLLAPNDGERRKITGQHTPLAAALVDIEDGIHHLSQACLERSSSAAGDGICGSITALHIRGAACIAQ